MRAKERTELLNKQYQYMTENDLLIDVRDVSMRYSINSKRINTLKEYVISKVKGEYKNEEKWVLDNVNLQIKRGESVGLIGRNGAGKSTLLKLISGILQPTKGEIYTVGKMVSLLRLGAGFDMEANAKENIVLNGAIMGIGRKEMEAKFDSILDFCELGNQIDKPLKSYSSGMLSRLGFAIAVDVSPDILLLDEVLAVGDAPFKKKCAEKMKALQANGTTFIVVSHSNKSIIDMCQKAVWLRQSHIFAEGAASEVISEYEKWCKEEAHNPELIK